MNQLIQLADAALRSQAEHSAPGASAILNGGNIDKSYNGSVAALGVAIAMGELLPTLAIYYQDKVEGAARTNANRRSVLDVIARMITNDPGFAGNYSAGNNFPGNLFQAAIQMNANDADGRAALTALKEEVIACSIALKHVVRTYQLT